MVLHGGSNEATETWEYDGTAWELHWIGEAALLSDAIREHPLWPTAEKHGATHLLVHLPHGDDRIPAAAAARRLAGHYDPPLNRVHEDGPDGQAGP